MSQKMSIEYIIQKTAKILTRFWLYLENQHNVKMTFTKGSWLLLFRLSLHSIISALKRCKTKLTILKLASQKRILDGAYFDNSAILLSAEPARNHSSCDSFMVWFSWISSWLPSVCFSTVFTGFRVKERERYVDQFVPHGNLSILISSCSVQCDFRAFPCFSAFEEVLNVTHFLKIVFIHQRYRVHPWFCLNCVLDACAKDK